MPICIYLFVSSVTYETFLTRASENVSNKPGEWNNLELSQGFRGRDGSVGIATRIRAGRS